MIVMLKGLKVVSSPYRSLILDEIRISCLERNSIASK